jgi:hypothetical protein
MASFLAGLAVAAVLTLAALVLYGQVAITPVETAAIPGVHVADR